MESAEAQTAPPPQTARLTRTVPREYVHRAVVAEVFLTSWTELEGERCAVSAQWPRGHSFFSPIDRSLYDPMLVAETIRQIGALIAHTSFRVPLGQKFLLRELGYTVDLEQLAIGAAPASLDIDVTCSDVQCRKDRLTGLRYEAAIRHEGVVIGTGGAHFTCVSPAVYRRLRERRIRWSEPPRSALRMPVAPQRVGRQSPFDVVLAPSDTPHRWQLRVDPSHPILFDHPVDHIPGMALLEAARQAVHALAPEGRSMVLSSVDSSFPRFAEFDRPCWIVAERDPRRQDDGRWRVTGHQEGDTVFSATVTGRPAPFLRAPRPHEAASCA
ncbi:ScbA/BarX family gamma-butyrolactone biosynthesis protein [Streptomyces amakusaensis]|uniref:ScbA/BarX family gamma-butyrolactone biosynthesis protein n=1 Tax=Streptomyces amakusaensis TaxID=67271 RepID=A0ABW0ALW9_9ACTN